MGDIPAEEAAGRAGISVSTWRAYVARGQAPAARAGFNPVTGRRMWDEQVVAEWLAHRPGQGARTDRRKKRDEPADPAGPGEVGP